MSMPRWINAALLVIVVLLLATIFNRFRSETGQADEPTPRNGSAQTANTASARQAATRRSPASASPGQRRRASNDAAMESGRRSTAAPADNTDRSEAPRAGPLSRNPIGFATFGNRSDADPEDSNPAPSSYPGLETLRTRASRLRS
ncbi:MAG: hypothetical protein ACO3KY_08725 [Lysobacterales bacterium]